MEVWRRGSLGVMERWRSMRANNGFARKRGREYSRRRVYKGRGGYGESVYHGDSCGGDGGYIR